jgi:predicted sulfurtransferase
MATMAETTDQSSPESYRILALYRFVPLVPSAGRDSDASDDNNDSLTAHPERHPILKNLQSELYDALRPLHVRGTLLLAPEGINGTICYPFTSREHIIDDADDPVYSFLKGHALFGGPDLRTRLSEWKDFVGNEDKGETSCSNLEDADKKIQKLKQPQQAFQRLKIKIKAEIVTMGLGRPLFCNGKATEEQSMLSSDTSSQASSINESSATRHLENQKCNPLLTKGQYLSPSEWDEAVKNPEVLVIDTRNTYEIEIGTFDGALDPKTKHFAEFPDYLEKLADEFDWSKYNQISDDGHAQIKPTIDLQGTTTQKKKPPQAIAMFCTGGIRCEKATSYALQSNLFPKNMPIYHLEGGILAYLDHVSKEKEDVKAISNGGSTFHGECFVFDKRVAVTEGLKPSKNYIPCYGCRGPMDRRLLLSISDNNCGDKRKATEADGDQSKIPSKYQTLLEGIPNLPELKYDVRTDAWYLPGLTCPRCHDGTTRESLERFAQRKEQMEICAKEGKSHFRDGKSEALKYIS